MGESFPVLVRAQHGACLRCKEKVTKKEASPSFSCGTSKRWYGMDIGNGGLSLSKTKAMIRITKGFKFNETENEDIYFARGVSDIAARDPSIVIPPIT